MVVARGRQIDRRSDDSAVAAASCLWRTREVDRQKALVISGVETCSRRSAPDGRLEYPIGKDEARESRWRCRRRSGQLPRALQRCPTDTSALRVTTFTVSRALPRVPECSCCSLLRMSCRAQKNACMTLSYPFTVRETHRRLAGPAGDESYGGTLDTPYPWERAPRAPSAEAVDRGLTMRSSDW